MKRILRGMLAAMLAVILTAFALWRYEKLAVLTDFTDLLAERLGNRLGQLGQMVSPDVGGGNEAEDSPQSPIDPGSDFSDYNPQAPVNAALEETILAGLLAMREDIDLKSYGITGAELGAAMAKIIYSTPQLFYLGVSYTYSSDAAQRVVALKPSYLYTPAEVAVMRTEYQAALAEIVANAPVTGSDFEKILYLHDYFVRNYSYDKSLTIRDAYTFFTEKTGVCQAYMLGLIAAADALGLESLPVTSDAMKHAWNLVRIDGCWYHVDITWDDSNTLPTRMSYRYFLQSDTGLAEIDAGKDDASRHRAWTAAEPATDGKYDHALFREANTNMVCYDGVYYVAVKDGEAAPNVRGTIYCGEDPMSLVRLTDITGGVFAAAAGSYYPDCFCDLFLDGSTLYYHSGNSIGYVDLSASSLQYRVLFPGGLAMGESIYGFLEKKNQLLTVVVSTSPNVDTYRAVAVQIP